MPLQTEDRVMVILAISQQKKKTFTRKQDVFSEGAVLTNSTKEARERCIF